MPANRKRISPERGEVYLLNFDPSMGSEIKKTRPAIILQNDISNKHSPVTIVAAITSQFDYTLYPDEVLVLAPEGGLKTDSVVALNQIQTVDSKRLIKKMGYVSTSTMSKIDSALRISLGLINI